MFGFINACHWNRPDNWGTLQGTRKTPLEIPQEFQCWERVLSSWSLLRLGSPRSRPWDNHLRASRYPKTHLLGHEEEPAQGMSTGKLTLWATGATPWGAPDVPPGAWKLRYLSSIPMCHCWGQLLGIDPSYPALPRLRLESVARGPLSRKESGRHSTICPTELPQDARGKTIIVTHLWVPKTPCSLFNSPPPQPWLRPLKSHLPWTLQCLQIGCCLSTQCSPGIN